MDPSQADPDLRTVTQNPGADPRLDEVLESPGEGLYKRDGRSIDVQQDGQGPAITYKGYSKEPITIVVEILEDGSAFRFSTDGGETFGAAQSNPVAGGPAYGYSTDGGTRFRDGMPRVWGGEGLASWSTDGGKTFSEDPPPREAKYDFTVPGTLLPWAIKFSMPKDPNNLLDSHFVGEWLHPTQLYLALNVLLISLMLLGRLRMGVWFDGELVALGMILYGITRFFIEFTRGDVARGFHGGLSTSQWVSFPFLAIGIFLYVRFYLKHRKQRASAN